MTDYKILQPWMRPFPSPEEVFAGDIAKHAEHFQPLLSIEAAQVDPSWQGWLHFVTPLEPYEGYIGEYTCKDLEGYTRANWVAFQRESDGRLKFMEDWRYFLLESKSDNEAFKYFTQQDVEAHYQKVTESYAKSKDFYKEHGVLNGWAFINDEEGIIAYSWLDELGGAAWDSNWSASENFAFEYEEGIDEDGDTWPHVHPLTHDGRRFRYVGGLTGYHYRKHAAGFILMFYDPQEKVILFTFDWS